MNATIEYAGESRANHRPMELGAAIAAFVKFHVLGVVFFGAYCFIYLMSYIHLISPIYSYAGLRYRELPDRIWAVMILLACIPYLALNKRFERPSDYASWIICLFVVVPGCFIPFFIFKQDPYEILPLPAALVVSFLIFELVRRWFPMPAISRKWTMPSLVVIVPVFIFVMSVYILYLGNFHIDLSFSDVYTRRLLTRETAESRSIQGYILAWLGAVGIPMGIIIAMLRKNILSLGLALLAIVSVFSLDGTKSNIFMPVVIILAIATFPVIRSHGLPAALLFLIALIGFSIAENRLWGSHVISTVFVRREMATPAQLTSYYWQYFSSHPFVYLGDSILRFIPGNNTIDNVGLLIGYKYFGNIETNSNANFLASGYAQFGYLGMLGASIAGGIVFRVLDKVGTGEKLVPACALSVAIGLIYVNSAFLTALVTEGVVFTIFIVSAYPWKGQTTTA